jgi:hypothetical protein
VIEQGRLSRPEKAAENRDRRSRIRVHGGP